MVKAIIQSHCDGTPEDRRPFGLSSLCFCSNFLLFPFLFFFPFPILLKYTKTVLAMMPDRRSFVTWAQKLYNTEHIYLLRQAQPGLS